MCYYHAVSECGTVGCLAGLTVLTWPEEARIAAANVLSPGGPPDYVDIGDVAAAVLGLSNKLKYALFHGYDEEPATPEARCRGMPARPGRKDRSAGMGRTAAREDPRRCTSR